jgi:hypothetical protein
MGRKAGSAGIWHRTPLEVLAVVPIPVGIWTAIAAAEAIALSGTVIAMVCFPGSPSSAMAVRGFVALSLVAMVVAAITVVVFSGRPRYSRQHRG